MNEQTQAMHAYNLYFLGPVVGLFDNGKGMLASVGRLEYSTAIISYETLHSRS
jgi:hypothetical protein